MTIVSKQLTSEQVFEKLKSEFRFVNAKGTIRFNLNNFEIVVKQNSVVGNIIEDWLAEWFTSNGIVHEHNLGQSAPDFWLDPEDKTKDLLEVKCFYRNPGFDIANFLSYINEIIDKPYRLHSKYLLILYDMNPETGIISITNAWLKNVWEIACSSNTRPIKVQEKKKVIYNIRPAVWYSETSQFPTFKSLEHFLSALEQTLYDYNQTRTTIAEEWQKRLCDAYKKHYGIDLILPRWYDIKNQYIHSIQ